MKVDTNGCVVFTTLEPTSVLRGSHNRKRYNDEPMKSGKKHVQVPLFELKLCQGGATASRNALQPAAALPNS